MHTTSITVRYTPAAQSAALTAGIITPQVVKLAGEIDPERLAVIAPRLTIDADGVLSVSGVGRYCATLAQLVEDMAHEIEVESEAKRAEAEARNVAIDAYLAGGPSYPYLPTSEPRRAAVEAETARRNSLVEVETARCAQVRRDAEHAKVAAEDSREAAILAYLATWIRERGDESQRQRLDADPDAPLGLLPRAEAIEAVRASVLPATTPFYKRIAASDLDLCDEDAPFEHKEDDVSFKSNAASQIPADAWARWQALLPQLPAETVTLRMHTATCSTRSCPATHDVTRYGALCSVTVCDGLTLSREYAV